jgi:hypothetical protein
MVGLVNVGAPGCWSNGCEDWVAPDGCLHGMAASERFFRSEFFLKQQNDFGQAVRRTLNNHLGRR